MRESGKSWFDRGYPGITAIEASVCPKDKNSAGRNYKGPQSPYLYSVYWADRLQFTGNVNEVSDYMDVQPKTVSDGCVKGRLIKKKFKVTRRVKEAE